MIILHLANLLFICKALGCDFCGKILKLSIKLERHDLANVLFIFKALGCDFCGKIFKVTINLEKQMKIVHFP